MHNNSRAKSKRDQISLCEKSMKVASNILRLSSFSLARRTLGATAAKSPKEHHSLMPDGQVSDTVPDEMLLLSLSKVSGNRRLQEPQSRSNPTYVIKPVGRNGSNSHVIHKENMEINSKKEECVDGLASDYIRKIRKQLGCGL